MLWMRLLKNRIQIGQCQVYIEVEVQNLIYCNLPFLFVCLGHDVIWRVL